MLRFDFSHFEGVTAEELDNIQNIVNQKINEFLPVKTEQMSMAQAQEAGARALFGEKYGEQVRVVSAGDWSKGPVRRYPCVKYRRDRRIYDNL